MKKKKTLLYYIISFAVGLVISIPVAFLRGLGTAPDAAFTCRYLSDGLFVAGMLLTGFGMLVWISTTGFFDMFSYAGHSLLVLFTSLRNPKEHESFYDYKLKKEEKRGQSKPYILLVGIGYILAALVCLFLYYNL